jgi:hypothetical protein
MLVGLFAPPAHYGHPDLELYVPDEEDAQTFLENETSSTVFFWRGGLARNDIVTITDRTGERPTMTRLSAHSSVLDRGTVAVPAGAFRCWTTHMPGQRK